MELLAIFYALQAFYCDCHDVHIEIQSDSISAIRYVNNFGGMNSVDMDDLSKQIWEWYLCRNIYISGIDIPGILNSADFYSRNYQDSTEWMLKLDIFERLCKQTDTDLFASTFNTRLPEFISWFLEPDAYAVNAFSLSWSGFLLCIFPPFNLIGKVINKIISDKVEKALMAVPYWFTQSWFPVLMGNICDFPIR